MSDVVDRGGAWAVVGAGPHGLSALKNLLELGLDADGFERDTDLGGNWNFHAENSRVYESTHLISTKPFTQFPDFPMPDAYPDYPSHWQVHRYFRSYAEHFGLFEHLHLNSEVVSVTPAPGERWDVSVLDRSTGETTTRQYAGVVIANGHNWWPKIPQYPGQDTFTGEIKHSADYKSADVVRGKRVLVVGAGNTGCDVAVESAQNAKETYHSTRRGYYYNPKYAFGRPSDQTADLLLALRLPLALRRVMFKSVLRLTVGDFEKFGLRKPDHEFFETHPIVNQQLVYYVGHGDIQPKPDIDRFDGSTVYFEDGTSAEIDVVVFCTGYLAYFPFLDDSYLNPEGDHPVLARQIFTPATPTLAVSGLIQPDSGQWTIAHWQGMLIAAYAAVRARNPERARTFFDRMIAERDVRFTGGTTYKDSTRHYFEIAHQEYLRAIEVDFAALEAALPLERSAVA
jgi:thioredoxin reductase